MYFTDSTFASLQQIRLGILWIIEWNTLTPEDLTNLLCVNQHYTRINCALLKAPSYWQWIKAGKHILQRRWPLYTAIKQIFGTLIIYPRRWICISRICWVKCKSGPQVKAGVNPQRRALARGSTWLSPLPWATRSSRTISLHYSTPLHFIERNKMLVNSAMRGHAIRCAKSRGLSAPLWCHKVEEVQMDEGFFICQHGKLLAHNSVT